MKLDEIKKIIVERADEDLVERYLRKAEIHFKRAVSLLLGNTEAGLTEMDFSGVVRTERLVLGSNCFQPDSSSFSKQNTDDMPIFRPLGAWHFGEGYQNVRIVTNSEEFNSLINNPVNINGDIVYLHFSGKKLIAFPEPNNIMFKYIRMINYVDPIWLVDLDNFFSMKFINLCIDTALLSFKAEVMEI